MTDEGKVTDVKLQRLTPPVELCEHLTSLIESLKPLTIQLNDGFCDEFICMEHDEQIILTENGDIERVRKGKQWWVRSCYSEKDSDGVWIYGERWARE